MECATLRHSKWHNTLYQELNDNAKPVTIKLIPYVAWANTGKSGMSVWLPVLA
ncbi:hypothetical protein [[Flexibacter] sp. ATCC 35208]|uniref:hypothetical protein n=1 Tax=[Flexibacter] sp. ATCC 35208 TaxID=1936242 RepID=UPI0015C3F987|nr:hypothetical protein [[Flexibacter] sp. ATCC 35208]